MNESGELGPQEQAESPPPGQSAAEPERGSKWIILGLVGLLVVAGTALVLVLVLVVFKSGPSEPEKVVNDYFKALENKDFELLAETMGLAEPTMPSAYIRVFLVEDITDEQIESLRSYIRGLEGVENVEYMSKEEALEEFKEMYADQQDILEDIEGNPLPAQLRITTEDPEYNEEIVTSLEDRPEISTDPDTGKKEITEPVDLADSIGDSPLFEDSSLTVTFRDMKYETIIEGDFATVGVVDGVMTLDSELGMPLTVRVPNPLPGVSIPFEFELEKRGGKWYITATPSELGSKENANARTCQANQRTVDGAIQSYQANDPEHRYPDSLGRMTEPGLKVLKSVPTCPTTGEYIWVPGDPPYISCPEHSLF